MERTMTQQVIICKGIPASGKSTWATAKAKEAGWKRVNKDELRRMLDGGKYSKSNEMFVLELRDSIIASALRKGHNVVVDDTNLYPCHESSIKHIVDIFNSVHTPYDMPLDTPYREAVVEVKWFPITLEDALARDCTREHMVGREVIEKMYKQYQKAGGPTPEPIEVVKQEINPDLPWCIICDLDGTLSKFKEKGHRGPFDASKCDEDDVNYAVGDLLRIIEANNYYMSFSSKPLTNYQDTIFVSGRFDTYKQQTLKFFDKYGFNYSVSTT